MNEKEIKIKIKKKSRNMGFGNLSNINEDTGYLYNYISMNIYRVIN